MVMNSQQDAAITAAETARLVRQLADIESIRQLKHRYCELCDADYDADALAALFTDDAVWDGGPMGAHHGRDAIRRFFEGSCTRDGICGSRWSTACLVASRPGGCRRATTIVACAPIRAGASPASGWR